MDGTILIADDDRTLRTVLTHALTRAGCKVHATASLETLTGWVEQGKGDLVITDVVMPDGNGIDNLQRIFTLRPQLPVIVISAQNTITTAVKAQDAQAFHYLPKPFDLPELLRWVRQGLDAKSPRKSLPNLQETDVHLTHEMIGRSDAMQSIYRFVAQVKDSPLPVMIVGESGTGKTLTAHAMHRFSKAKNTEFTCLSAHDFASQGTGDGHLANVSGSVLIENIQDLNAFAQGALLSAIEAATNIKIYSTTNDSILEQLDTGDFRTDLYYRLNGLSVNLPPLRERLDDIEPLVEHFTKQGYSKKGGLLSENALAYLMKHDWPGNIRELANVIERLMLLSAGEKISLQLVQDALPVRQAKSSGLHGLNGSLSDDVSQRVKLYFQQHLPDLPPDGLYTRILNECEKPLIELALDATLGNQAKCADLLGINRNTLRKKILQLDVTVTRSRRLM